MRLQERSEERSSYASFRDINPFANESSASIKGDRHLHSTQRRDRSSGATPSACTCRRGTRIQVSETPRLLDLCVLLYPLCPHSSNTRFSVARSIFPPLITHTTFFPAS